MIRFTMILASVFFLAAVHGCSYSSRHGWQVEELQLFGDPRGDGPYRNHPQILAENKIYDGPVGPRGY